jgi:hypothetical protein
MSLAEKGVHAGTASTSVEPEIAARARIDPPPRFA